MSAASQTDDTQAVLTTLRERIAHWTERKQSNETSVPGLSLFRWDEPTDFFAGMYKPSLCLVVQGAKRVMLGADIIDYDPQTYVITSVHLPTLVQIRQASPEEPYLGMTLAFSPRDISRLLAEHDLPEPPVQKSIRGMATGKVGRQLLDAVARLVDLLEDEADIAVLAPIIQREITYRLLIGEQGWRLRQIVSAGSASHQISRVVEWMTSNYKQPVRVDELAEQAGMSSSTFHHHFRSMTALSPLQYQKQLRLREARRLMLAERLDAGDAAFEVGYESPSQFSREYSRLFGAPPKQDVRNLTGSPSAELA